MSYRNAPIIVDRSTDVWGKAIANFGQQVAQGILSIGDAKKKAGQIKAAKAAQAAKDAAAMQKLTTATRESYMSNFRDSYIALKKKDGNLADQFKKQTMIDLNGDGKKMGAIDAQVQLSLNSNLSATERKEYRETVDNAKMYQAQAVDGFGKVISGIDNVKSKSHELLAAPGGWTFKGNNNLERLQNQLAYYAVNVDKMINPDVKESRKMVRGDKGENFLEATTLVPLDQFKEGGVFSGQLTPEQEKGMEKVVEGGKEYYKFSFKRDANEWDGEFIVDIHDLPDYSEVYQEAGIEDKKGTINQKLTGQIEIAEGGYEDKEELIDINAIRKNESLNTIMLGKASAIEQGDDASKQAFLNFALGEGGTNIKEFNKQYPLSEGRVQRIKNLLIDDSISKKFEKKYSSRAATPEDVKRLKAFNPASEVSEGDEILFSNIGSKKAKVKDPAKVTEGAIKRADYERMVKYLDSRFTPDNLTFESVESLANEEGITVVPMYATDEDEKPSEIKVGKLKIKPGDSHDKIKKILLIAGGVKPKDAQALIDGKEIYFRPNTLIKTGNLPITKE
jgi:hypothetical protein